MGAIIDQTDVEARLSASVVRQIFDDDNDGVADAHAIAGLIRDAEAKVTAALGAIYPDGIAPPVTDELKRLTLDMVTVYARQRHPEYARGEWKDLLKATESDLKHVRDGIRGLGPSPPESAIIHGGDVYSGDADAADPVDPVFLDGTGDF